jgi:hypothetical protein
LEKKKYTDRKKGLVTEDDLPIEEGGSKKRKAKNQLPRFVFPISLLVFMGKTVNN